VSTWILHPEPPGALFRHIYSFIADLNAQALTKYPSAVTHGMGDSCFNGGMKQITALIGNVSQQSVLLPRTAP